MNFYEYIFMKIQKQLFWNLSKIFILQNDQISKTIKNYYMNVFLKDFITIIYLHIVAGFGRFRSFQHLK